MLNLILNCFFQYVNSKLKPKENVSSLLKEDGSLTNDDFADCGCNPDTSVQCNENGTCQCKTNFGGQKCNNCSDISFGEFPNCIGKIVKNL